MEKESPDLTPISDSPAEVTKTDDFKLWRTRFLYGVPTAVLFITILKIDRKMVAPGFTAFVIEMIGQIIAVCFITFLLGGVWELTAMGLKRRKFDRESYMANVVVVGVLAILSILFNVFHSE